MYGGRERVSSRPVFPLRDEGETVKIEKIGGGTAMRVLIVEDERRLAGPWRT